PTWNAAVCTGDIGRFSIAGDFNGFQTGPITEPIILQRNGKRLEYIGETTIGSGAELRVETSRDSLTLSLTEMDDGSWVILEFPGYATAVEGTQVSSLAELREASQTSWFSENGTLGAKPAVDNGAGLTVAPGSAPPGFAARTLPVGAKIEVGRAEGAAGQQVAAR